MRRPLLRILRLRPEHVKLRKPAKSLVFRFAKPPRKTAPVPGVYARRGDRAAFLQRGTGTVFRSAKPPRKTAPVPGVYARRGDRALQDFCHGLLGEDISHDDTRNVCEPEAAALIWVGQALMIEA